MLDFGKKKVTAGVLGLLLMGGPLTGMAAEAAEDNEGVQDIVITANRIPNRKVDTPANVSIVTAQQIEDWNSRSVADALENVPGVRVMRSGAGALEQHILLNGDDRVLMLVDGRRVNGGMGQNFGKATFDANTLPPVEMIDHVEIIKGGASTVYGADAVGGVINIITKTPEKASGKVHAGYGSWGSQQWGVDFTDKVGKTGIVMGAGREKVSHMKYKDADGNMKQWNYASNYTQDRLSLKLTQDFTDAEGLTLAYDYSNLDGINPNFLGSMNWYDLGKVTNNVGLTYDWNRNQKNSGFLRAYRNYYRYSSIGYGPYATAGDMKSVDWAVEGQQNFVLSDTNTLVAGLEYRRSAAENSATYSGSRNFHNRAVFLQDQWEFAPTWQLNTGVRYDNHSKAGSRTTGSAGLNKKFNENSHAYFSWNQVFRTPTMDDLYYWNPSWMMYGNENLKPETGNVYSLGYNFKSSPATEWNVNAFYSNLHDAIRWTSFPDYSWRVQNIDKQKKRGMELSVNHKLNDHWDLNASYTYVKVDNNTNDGHGYVRDLNYAPNYYQFGIRYHDDSWNINLVGRAANGLSRERFGENRYLTMDLNARYTFDKHWTGFASVYNLNNAAYTEYGGVINGQDLYPMPGRRFVVGAEYKF